MSETTKPNRVWPGDCVDPQDVPPAVEPGMLGSGSRQSARAALYDLIARHQRAAQRLTSLSEALPEKLSEEADDALWTILMGYRV